MSLPPSVVEALADRARAGRRARRCRSARSPPTGWAAGRPCSCGPSRPTSSSPSARALMPRPPARARCRSSSWVEGRTCSSPTGASPASPSCWGRVWPASRWPPPMVTAGGGASLPVVARRSAAAGLTGFEWAVGVPGSIGGAVRMNAGGHGSDMAATLVRVRVVDLRSGEDGWMPAGALELGYRRSALRAPPGRRRRRAAARAVATAPRPRPRSPRSCAGGGSTSPAGPTPARCSPTRPATPPDASSTTPAPRAGGTARPRCRPSTPTSSRPTTAARPTTSPP